MAEPDSVRGDASEGGLSAAFTRSKNAISTLQQRFPRLSSLFKKATKVVESSVELVGFQSLSAFDLWCQDVARKFDVSIASFMSSSPSYASHLRKCIGFESQHLKSLPVPMPPTSTNSNSLINFQIDEFPFAEDDAARRAHAMSSDRALERSQNVEDEDACEFRTELSVRGRDKPPDTISPEEVLRPQTPWCLDIEKESLKCAHPPRKALDQDLSTEDTSRPARSETPWCLDVEKPSLKTYRSKSTNRKQYIC